MVRSLGWVGARSTRLVRYADAVGRGTLPLPRAPLSLVMTRYRAHFTTSGAAGRRCRLNFRGAVKRQNGALNANEILE